MPLNAHPILLARMIALGAIVVTLMGCGAGVPPAAWVPDEALLAKLGPPEPLVHGYEMRVPPDWHPTDESGDNSFGRSWDNFPTKFNPGTLQKLSIEISGPLTAQQQQVPLPELFANWRNGFNGLKDVFERTFSPVESGTVHGVPFNRCKARVIYQAGAGKGVQTILAVAYITRTDGRAVRIEGVAAGKDGENRLKEIEAAILTFRKP